MCAYMSCQALPAQARRFCTSNGCWHSRASWAAGTGYGTDHSRMGGQPSPIWDAKHAEASQAAQDAELEKLLTDLAESELQTMFYSPLFCSNCVLSGC